MTSLPRIFLDLLKIKYFLETSERYLNPTIQREMKGSMKQISKPLPAVISPLLLPTHRDDPRLTYYIKLCLNILLSVGQGPRHLYAEAA